MAKGWATNKKQQKRYFDPNTGAMYKGFKKIGSDTYYFYSKSGVMATGWVTNSKKGYKYYFDPSTGVMATGMKTIDGKKYTFGSNGVLHMQPKHYYSYKLQDHQEFPC